MQRIGIVAPLRSPVGKIAGCLAEIEPHSLQAHLMRASLERSGVAADRLDDVIVGNVTNSIGNIARIAALEAGIPVEVPAVTVDRQCASSMEALVQAAAKIDAGLAQRVLVGGVESASRAPWLYEKTARPYSFTPPRPYRVRFATEEVGDPPMGEIAELLADEFKITREEMDCFAAESHQRVAKAQESGALAAEMVPITIPQRKGDPLVIERDESVRADSTPETLAKLRPAFRKDGRVTAGNSSPMNDGAAACVAMSEAACASDGVAPLAWLLGAATVGLLPARMGMGPAMAIPRLLEQAGLTPGDIDLFEINEAFASQILAVNRELGIPAEKLNVNGGAIAIGHPLGASGLRIVVTLIHALRARGLRRGVASLCVGGGQGMAVLIEIPKES